MLLYGLYFIPFSEWLGFERYHLLNGYSGSALFTHKRSPHSTPNPVILILQLKKHNSYLFRLIHG